MARDQYQLCLALASLILCIIAVSSSHLKRSADASFTVSASELIWSEEILSVMRRDSLPITLEFLGELGERKPHNRKWILAAAA